MNILVIEDDPSVRTLVKAVLEHNGNSVSTADNATDGEANAIENEYDMIILDLGLPDGDGYEVCKNIRARNIETPVLILSGEQETDVKVKMLKVGADDYLTKPFNTEELIARMTAINRRTESGGEQQLTCKELKVNLLKRECSIKNEKIQLTNNEFNLLVYFM